MYFESFPYTYYSLDDIASVQVVTNITSRVKIDDYVKNNLALLDTYDIKEGETPEIVADKFYNNAKLHWIVLLTNEILDPRFGWPLTSVNLNQYIIDKYGNASAIHHFEDGDGNYVNGVINVDAADGPDLFNYAQTGDIVVNNSNKGTGFITRTTLDGASDFDIKISNGGFRAGDQIRVLTDSNITGNINVTTVVYGTPVTNYVYEELENESKRKIKLIKSAYVDSIIKDFKKKLGE